MKKPGKRNPYITEAMERVLRQLRDGQDQYGILDGNEFWVDDVHSNKQLLLNLLRLCLVKADSGNDERSEIYYINEDGRGVLGDPNYVPNIVSAMRARRSQ